MVCKNDEELYFNLRYKYKIQISPLSLQMCKCKDKRTTKNTFLHLRPNQVHDMHDHSLILTQFIELAWESIKKVSNQLNVDLWLKTLESYNAFEPPWPRWSGCWSIIRIHIKKFMFYKTLYLRWSGCAKWEERKGHEEKAGLVNRFVNIHLFIMVSCVRSLWINFPMYEAKDEVSMISYFCTPLFGSNRDCVGWQLV